MFIKCQEEFHEAPEFDFTDLAELKKAKMTDFTKGKVVDLAVEVASHVPRPEVAPVSITEPKNSKVESVENQCTKGETKEMKNDFPDIVID